MKNVSDERTKEKEVWKRKNVGMKRSLARLARPSRIMIRQGRALG